MPYITEIEREGRLVAALAAFSQACAEHAAELSLTSVDLDEIAAMADDFAAAVGASFEAKAAWDAALSAKAIQRKTSAATLAKWAATFRADQSVSDALLAGLQLPAHKTPGTFTPPAVPMDLTASPDAGGWVGLRWNRNGNRQGTQFLVQQQSSPHDPWILVHSTTRVRARIPWTVGAYAGFRVIAKRGDRSSPASVPVVVGVSNGSALRAA